MARILAPLDETPRIGHLRGMADFLPIHSVLTHLRQAIAARGMAVLQAPPGAGKTTVVPLDLLDSGLIHGRIVMLEPRRLAARAAAERMAETIQEAVGARVGYRIRGEARVSAQTRIEVVTEGILTRMIQSDPELPGVGALIFDEFHERSLNADLGLALALEIRAALRPDLVLIVMSATLDAAPVAALMGDAPVVTSEGRAFPVETRWLPRSPDASLRYEAVMAGLITQAATDTCQGGILVFLPGEGEIRRVASALEGRLGPEFSIRPLFGALDFAAQRAALAPAPGRKLVLATSIAETSLTIPDVTVVVDGGKSRRARFDAASAMSRLVTERVTRAEAEQRRGRAGRVAPGICYRAWTRGEEGGLSPFPPAEIEAADLTPLALELALWGSDRLPFLTEPNPGALFEARALLNQLGALDRNRRITPHGRVLAALPLHPRLGHMLAIAGPAAAPLAALLSDRDPLQGAPADLNLRLLACENPRAYQDRHPWPLNRPALDRIREEAKRLARGVEGPAKSDLTPAQMAALAYPDRIGLRRMGEAPRWLFSGGKGAALAAGQALSQASLLVATDLDGDRSEATIRQAIAISELELRAVHGKQFQWLDRCDWSRRDGRVIARKQEVFGAIVLDDRPWPDAPADAMARAALDGLRQIGLSLSPAAYRLRARIELARAGGTDWPDCRDEALLADSDWLLPFLTRAKTASDLRALDLVPALQSRLDWGQQAELDRLVPGSFTTPLGRQIPIDYDAENPGISVRLQEMFGVTVHPATGKARLPLRITLLSPAQRPIAVTMDLPGFWRAGYADVRRDMRGQYPRHPWPEDPTQADPTLRAKPRGT